MGYTPSPDDVFMSNLIAGQKSDFLTKLPLFPPNNYLFDVQRGLITGNEGLSGRYGTLERKLGKQSLYQLEAPTNSRHLLYGGFSHFSPQYYLGGRNGPGYASRPRTPSSLDLGGYLN